MYIYIIGVVSDLRKPEISKETEPDLSAAYLDSFDMWSPV